MNSIQIVNAMTPADWRSVKSKGLLSEKYLSSYDENLFKEDLIKRVQNVCNKYSLPIPKKITIADKSVWGIDLITNSEELILSPMDFLVSRLTKDMMTPEHRLMHKQLDQLVAKMDKLFQETQLEIVLAEKEKIVKEYGRNFEKSLRKYKDVLTDEELNNKIAFNLTGFKAVKSLSVFTLETRKICMCALTAFNALMAGLIISQFASNRLYSGSAALIAGGLTAIKSKKIIEGMIMIAAFFLLVKSEKDFLKLDEIKRKEQGLRDRTLIGKFLTQKLA